MEDYVFREDSWNEDNDKPDDDEGENRGVGMEEQSEETKKILYSILNRTDGKGESKPS